MNFNFDFRNLAQGANQWAVNLENSLFGHDGTPMGAGTRPSPQRPSAAPPVSKRLLRNLPTVRITSDDLIEETNKNCCEILII